MRATKVQASLRIRAVSPEPPLLAHTSSELGGTFRQKARSRAPLNGWACAVKVCHDGMLEDTNSLDAPQLLFCRWSSAHGFRWCNQNEKARYTTHTWSVYLPLFLIDTPTHFYREKSTQNLRQSSFAFEVYGAILTCCTRSKTMITLKSTRKQATSSRCWKP